jgi:ABC-type multidrug transport system fused ATPase/permease subunit
LGAWGRLLSAYVLPHRGRVAVLAAAVVASTAFEVAAPQVVRVFIDRATRPTGGPLLLVAVAYVVAVLLQQALRVAATWLGEQVGWLATNELRADLLAHVLQLDAEFHATHTPGELIERIDGDVNGLSTFFSGFVITVTASLLLLVGVVAVVWVRTPAAGPVLAVFAVVAVVSVVAVRRLAAPAWTVARERSALLHGFIEERLAGTVDLRSSRAEAHTLRGFYDLARDRLWAVSRARVLDGVAWIANTWVIAAANAIAFCVPAVLVSRGQLTLGGAFALYFYAQLVVQPLHLLGQQVEELQQAIAGGRRVADLLAIRPVMHDGDGPDLPPGPLGVALRGVTFGYGEGDDVLHEVDLDLAPGRVLGLVGRTASGKSTIARLLVRLHDVRAGAVLVGGADVRTLRRADLRRRVVLVTQDVHVLSATVRDNLTLFDPSVPDEAVLHAVTALGLDPWLRRLPAGLDTSLGDGGLGLAAGEAQLLALGRAFLVDPSVVILDEASSRLDPATEALLEDAVDRLLVGRTGIVIAHRLATLDRCDEVGVLEHGRLVEHGPRPALAADPTSRFAALLRAGLTLELA